MRVTFAGHSTVLIETAGVRLLTDPLLQRRVGHLLRHPEPVAPELWRDLNAVLVSHGHLDHLHMASLKKINREVPVITAHGLARTIGKAGFADVTELAPGESLQVGDARVTAVFAEHEVKRHPLADHSPALGFVVGGTPGPRVWFAGDTDVFDAMSDLARPPLGPVDLALVPVWGWGPKLGPGHMDPKAAAAAVRLVQPRVAVPIHWGTMLPAGMARLRGELLVNPPHAFARFVDALGLSTDVRILLPGQSTELDSGAVGGS